MGAPEVVFVRLHYYYLPVSLSQLLAGLSHLASLSDLIQAVPQFYLHSHFLIVLKRLRKSLFHLSTRD